MSQWRYLIGLPMLMAVPPGAEAQIEKIAPAVVTRLAQGEIVRVIVELRDDPSAYWERACPTDHDGRRQCLAERAHAYQRVKQNVTGRVGRHIGRVDRDYSQLPMAAWRIVSMDAALNIAADPQVVALYEDTALHTYLTQSAPLIRQTNTATLAQTGTGTTVAVLDTGVDYTRSAFGSCSAVNTPAATCKVVYAEDFAPNDGVPDANGHGSNVAGIVLGVAPGAKIVALDVFDGTTAWNVDVIDAINWAISNQVSYNIEAINLSLGSGLYSSACTNLALNPFRTPIINAKSAGIVTVAASGNDGSTSQIGMPACTPEAVAVGAVYDANVGNISYGFCSDTTTTADKVTCFSNSASILTMLAPGAIITAAGASYTGTSQAAPHVSGAMAVLRAAYPTDNVDASIARAVSNGKSVTDHRNSIIKPRLDLLAAVGAINDNFNAAVTWSGTSGTVYGYNVPATKEAGEPNHAGNTGGRSLWWKWTAAYNGSITVTTVGSSYDTLLGVYTGVGVAALTTIASNDNAPSLNTSAVSFTAAAGTVYHITVDGAGGASGTVNLNWNYVDSDGDTVIDPLDNCVSTSNTNQLDTDGDGQGNACDGDDDNDGMPDTWETANGLNALDAGDAVLDSDSDGFNNLYEYYAGMNPQQVDQPPASQDIPLLPMWAWAMLLTAFSAVGWRGLSKRGS